jgi:hypothetical protein
MHDRGLPLPTQISDGQARRFCGIEISIRNIHQHILRHHPYQGRRLSQQRLDELRNSKLED